MENIRPRETEVFVASAQKNLLKERMKLCRLLWDNNIRVGMSSLVTNFFFHFLRVF